MILKGCKSELPSCYELKFKIFNSKSRNRKYKFYDIRLEDEEEHTEVLGYCCIVYSRNPASI